MQAKETARAGAHSPISESVVSRHGHSPNVLDHDLAQGSLRGGEGVGDSDERGAQSRGLLRQPTPTPSSNATLRDVHPTVPLRRDDEPSCGGREI